MFLYGLEYIFQSLPGQRAHPLLWCFVTAGCFWAVYSCILYYSLINISTRLCLVYMYNTILWDAFVITLRSRYYFWRRLSACVCLCICPSKQKTEKLLSENALTRWKYVLYDAAKKWLHVHDVWPWPVTLRVKVDGSVRVLCSSGTAYVFHFRTKALLRTLIRLWVWVWRYEEEAAIAALL